MKNNSKKETVDISKLYGEDCIIPTQEFIEKHHINTLEGLSSDTASDNISKYGYNELKQAKEKKWYHYFFSSLFTPFNTILLGITIILFYTDVVFSPEPNFASIIVILLLVLSSTLLEFFTEYRSNKAADKLRSLVATKTTVLRNGKKISIPNKEIALNDLLILSAGDMIPADSRVIESKDLQIGQSSLTGESDAVRKVADTELNSIDDIDSVSDLDNICFMGTNVISGSAKAVVIKLANETYFGKVADMLSLGKPKSSFELGIQNISKILISFMLILIPAVFLVNIWKHDLLTAFTFAVAIAIGITPLLLPVILSSSLAKGAIRMSKKKTIVKKLDSIQSFGAMNILCTDKTGTLTEDKIVLEKYLDIKGIEDIRVLKHAFLNAYFQTGLKGNIDEAIINRALENNLEPLTTEYKKIDEIPFDFSRRRLSVVVEKDGKKQLITKGAVEEILSICSLVDYKGEVSPITNSIKENIRNVSKKLNKEGLRVIAVCQKNDIANIDNFSVTDESKMVLMGFIGFLDPPKESAKEAISKLNKTGIRIIVLTGDNADVTKCICNKVGVNSSRIILGDEIDKLTDMALLRVLKKTNIFAKLSPIQKARIVRLLKESGNVVGYMGDGINDSPSLTNADVGISVDSAVDIAKETADIILLEKDLKVLIDGALEGRRTFGNLLKYIKMAVSFNFGEVLSVIVASIFLPFLPITPIQLLVQSLLYDLGQLSLPFDNVDSNYLSKPRKWDLKHIKTFMLFMGPISSIFDLIVFSSLWFVFGLREPQAALFQTIWFSYGIVSNLVGLHVIRTAKLPFVQSNASKLVYSTSIALSIIALIIPGTFIGKIIGLVPLPIHFLGLILLIPLLYCIVALVVKKIYIKKYGEWI